jgi:hypothetical protein
LDCPVISFVILFLFFEPSGNMAYEPHEKRGNRGCSGTHGGNDGIVFDFFNN